MKRMINFYFRQEQYLQCCRLREVRRKTFLLCVLVVNADKIRKFVLEANPKNVVIVGTGFIGAELAESFSARGIQGNYG